MNLKGVGLGSILVLTLIVGPWSGPAWGRNLRVGTTNTLLADFVRQIGGREVTVKALVPPTVAPSKYQLRPLDIRVVSGYDLFLYGSWEVWTRKIVRALSGGRVKIVKIDIATGGMWGDPDQAKAIARQVAATLARHAPRSAPGLKAGLARLEKSIDRTIDQARRLLVKRRGVKVLACQDGLKYYFRPLGLDLVGLLMNKDRNQSMASGISPRSVGRFIDRGKKSGAKAIVFAPQLGLSDKCLMIGRQIGIPKIQVPLMPGSMPRTATYQAMMLEAARQIDRGLEGR
jgi:ABC-type Zn uptake system ZnuABC Zn-binding protein ZnuA